jgi:hypothetical protein
VRENTPPLSGKGNYEHTPHLWEPPPEPEIESPRVWEDAGASKDGLLGGRTGKTNSHTAKNKQARNRFARQLAIEEFQDRKSGWLTMSSILWRRS